MDRTSFIKRRAYLIDEMKISHPLDVAKNLGLAPNEEYEAYLERYEQMQKELAELNKQFGLPETSWQEV